MKKITIVSYLFLFIILCGCTEVINDYRLEHFKGSVVPVCVNHPQKMRMVDPGFDKIDHCGKRVIVPEKYEAINDECSKIEPFVVPYSNCLATLPLPVHLVEKKWET